MKKNQIVIIFTIVVMILTAGCTGNAKETIKPFCGNWKCQDTALETEEYYTGYMELYVKENGKFSIFDAEAGNPSISGKIEIDSDNRMTLFCDDENDFDPPATWEEMETTQQIGYCFVDDQTLELTYTDGTYTSTLVFERDS